jgi:hypothetical protein
VSDEFDEVRPALRNQRTRQPAPAARLLVRLYGAARLPLRARLLECLVKPLGPLGLVAVAAGAFGDFLYRGGARATMDDVARYSNEQVGELARFVEQVSPEALQECARLLAENPVGMAAFSASAAMLLLRQLGNWPPATGEASPAQSRSPQRPGPP